MTGGAVLGAVLSVWIVLMLLLQVTGIPMIKAALLATVGSEAVFLMMLLLGSVANNSDDVVAAIFVALAAVVGVACAIYYARRISREWDNYNPGEKVKCSLLSVTIPLVAALLGGVGLIVAIFFLVGTLAFGGFAGWPEEGWRIWQPKLDELRIAADRLRTRLRRRFRR